MSFTSYVEYIVSKAKQCLYALRKIRHLISMEDAKTIYMSIVRSRLEYCNTLLLFVNKSLSKKIEACQNKVIRIICKAPKAFSVTDSCRLLNLHTLASRRSYFYRQMVGKIQVGLCADALYSYIVAEAEQQSSDRQLRSKCSIVTPSINKEYGRNSLKYNATKILKEEICQPTSFLDFESN